MLKEIVNKHSKEDNVGATAANEYVILSSEKVIDRIKLQRCGADAE